ncbi:(2Fe-2S)-binding protein [Aeromicrobium choanae]|uniref:(2Fe-2S)-binding protein n=1 Tax=Aeromicrobium choanae TaxID=1736691 RepID=UPI0012946BAD|nr:(2Fe-2S)-binding protein [Aeromicrobium choanae]
MIRAVGESPVAEALSDAQQTVYRPLLEWARRSPLHSGVLGHSVHPVLTDVTLGCWLSASILDAAGGSGARASARLLVASGLAASVPTALAGAADWTELSGAERRIGAVHAAGTDIATCLLFGSLVARMRGNHAAGSKFAIAGNLVMVGAGLLGGHLALTKGTANRTSARGAAPSA